ncbi:hypothetical protein ACUOAQ_29070, partial [Escherichia sp. SP-MK]
MLIIRQRILPVHASSPKPGDFANTQARHIATF